LADECFEGLFCPFSAVSFDPAVVGQGNSHVDQLNEARVKELLEKIIAIMRPINFTTSTIRNIGKALHDPLLMLLLQARATHRAACFQLLQGLKHPPFATGPAAEALARFRTELEHSQRDNLFAPGS
jgi:hypothetical protein